MTGHPDMKLFVVGEYGRQFFMRHNVPIERSFLYTAQNPTMQRAREISAELLERFDSGELKKIFVVYTDIRNSLTETVNSTRLLPFHRSTFAARADEKKREETAFEFLPSLTEVLDSIVPSYVSGFIYSALIDSFLQRAERAHERHVHRQPERGKDARPAGAGVQPHPPGGDHAGDHRGRGGRARPARAQSKGE